MQLCCVYTIQDIILFIVLHFRTDIISHIRNIDFERLQERNLQFRSFLIPVTHKNIFFFWMNFFSQTPYLRNSFIWPTNFWTFSQFTFTWTKPPPNRVWILMRSLSFRWEIHFEGLTFLVEERPQLEKL